VTVHLLLDQLQPVDVAFYHAVAPGHSECGVDGIAISTEPARERCQRRVRSGLKPLQPRYSIAVADFEEASRCMAERFQLRRISIQRLQEAMSSRIGFQYQPGDMLEAWRPKCQRRSGHHGEA